MTNRFRRNMTIAFVAFFTLFIGAYVVLAMRPKGVPRATQATVVRIGPGSSGLTGAAPTTKVSVRSLEGLQRTQSVPVDTLRCAVGDTVKATVRGSTLSFDPKSCSRAP